MCKIFNSIVIELKAKQNGKLILYTGKKIHSVFLKMIREINESLSEKLHDDDTYKSFTVSSLLGLAIDKESEIYINKNYYIRFTILDNNLFKKIATNLFQKQMFKSDIKLENISFKVERVLYDNTKSQWAGIFDLNKIIHKEDFSKQITMRFYTPTLFKSGDKFNTKPEIRLIFTGLLRKYNKYSAYKLDESLIHEFENIVVKEDKTKLRKVQMKNGYFIGFTGNLTIEIQSENIELIKMINILSEFAFYAGVGYKTTMGLGQVKRV